MEEALKVVSFNVKRDSIFHGSHSWTNRRELVTRLIEESGAAIVGVQELMPAMKEDIRRLLDSVIDGYPALRVTAYSIVEGEKIYLGEDQEAYTASTLTLNMEMYMCYK